MKILGLRLMIVATGLYTWSAASIAAENAPIPHDNSITYLKKYDGPPKMPKGAFKMPTAPKRDWPINTIQPSISAEAKMRAVQSLMMFNPMSLRQMMNMMVAKKKAAEGVTFDQVIESMNLRANALNMKKVGHNTPWKVIEGITGKPTSRVEFVSYCDVITMRLIMDYVPEFGVFLPCKVAVIEDAKKQIWLMTIDWDVRWLDTSPNPNQMSADLRQRSIKIRESMEQIMEAGANGDL